VLSSGVEKIPEELLKKFSDNLVYSITKSLTERVREPTLRMSNIGKPCSRQLWYELNTPQSGDPLRPEAFMKFMYGHMIEELVLFLAELAGHEVKGQQDTQEIEGIKGHRDAVIDGTLVDVKSASSYSFKKFKEGRLKEDDAFGYIPQIQSYLYSGQDDPIITDKTKAAFLVVDKTLGHITLDFHEKDETDWPKLFNEKKEIVKAECPPERAFEPVPMGSSGNLKLGVNCSYCPFKRYCYQDSNDGQGLRTFLYSTGPVDLVKVVKEPLVPELLPTSVSTEVVKDG
jgi:hypothetical protein